MYIYYIHIWKVVALCESQTNYDYGGVAYPQGTKFGTEAPQ